MTDDADRTGWAVLVAASAGALLCFLNLSALNVALPAAARSLHASPAQASWILLSYMLVSTVCILSFGRLADLWGRRRLFLSGLSLFIAACAQPEPPPRVGMANPASVYCQSLGGKTLIRSNDKGQYGICQLPDGKQIEEWELYRRDHPAK